MLKPLAVFLFVLSIPGCYNDNPEELERLVKEDPVFAQLIAQRDRLHTEIKLIKKDLLNRKRAIDVQVQKLRDDYDVYAKEQNAKIEKLQLTIEAKRAVLKQEIETADAELEAKLNKLKEIQETYEDVRKVSQSTRIRLSNTEKERWQERLLDLSNEITRLEERVQELKLFIRLKKQKISFLH